MPQEPLAARPLPPAESCHHPYFLVCSGVCLLARLNSIPASRHPGFPDESSQTANAEVSLSKRVPQMRRSSQGQRLFHFFVIAPCSHSAVSRNPWGGRGNGRKSGSGACSTHCRHRPAADEACPWCQYCGDDSSFSAGQRVPPSMHSAARYRMSRSRPGDKANERQLDREQLAIKKPQAPVVSIACRRGRKRTGQAAGGAFCTVLKARIFNVSVKRRMSPICSSRARQCAAGTGLLK
jgi:hypothetical protein